MNFRGLDNLFSGYMLSFEIIAVIKIGSGSKYAVLESSGAIILVL
jgi:hypothetical protein